jgi:hypothetical protein
VLTLVLALTFLNLRAVLEYCSSFRVRFLLGLLLLVGGADFDGSTVTGGAGCGSGGVVGGGVDACDCNSAAAKSAVGAGARVVVGVVIGVVVVMLVLSLLL